MHIQSTKKVLDFFGIEPTNKNTDNAIYAWHANYEVVNRKKLLILMHDMSRFCVLIYGIKKNDKKNLTKIIKETMYVTMKSEAYGGFMIKAYLDNFDEVTFGKTKNRKMISRIVWLRDYVLSYMEKHGVYTDVHEQPQITTIINNNFVTDDNYKTWFAPNEKMINILEKNESEQLLCKLGDDFYTNRNL
ncbi:MAG: hypothetical protein QM489_01425 [Candidatus Izemoplasma sp.]